MIGNVNSGMSGKVNQTNLFFRTFGAQSCNEYIGGTVSASNRLVKLTQTELN
jgi:hypothetical protein